MSLEQFAALPDSIVVRELRDAITEKGFRPKQITLVTTLVNPEVYRLKTLADLYCQRWEIETNHAHYVQRFTFPQEDKSAYTGNQGIIGSGAMVPAMPAMPA